MLPTMRMRSQVVDPPPVAPGDGGGRGGWAWLLTARNLIEAHLVRGLLETEGIVPVAFDSSDPSAGAWLYISGNVNAPVRVFVPASLLDAARLAMLEIGFGPGETDEPERSAAAAERGLPIWTWMVAVLLLVVVVWSTVRAAMT